MKRQGARRSQVIAHGTGTQNIRRKDREMIIKGGRAYAPGMIPQPSLLGGSSSSSHGVPRADDGVVASNRANG